MIERKLAIKSRSRFLEYVKTQHQNIQVYLMRLRPSNMGSRSSFPPIAGQQLELPQFNKGKGEGWQSWVLHFSPVHINEFLT